jgi:hypothetical protein
MLLSKITKILLSERIKISKFISSLATPENNFSSSGLQCMVMELLKFKPMINQRQPSKNLCGIEYFI